MTNRIRSAALAGAAALALLLSACSGNNAGQGEAAASSDPAGGDRLQITGAGATFPKPLYEQWMGEYLKDHPNVSFTYEGVGSGEGVRRFLAGDVDFGGSDAALTDADLAKVGDRGVVMVPMTAGMVVLAYNLPGANGLKLSREAVAGIFGGRIRAWNDPRIAATNPDLTLPNKTLVPVVRRDSSGTTYAFTNHLGAANDWWASEGPGVGKVVQWPENAMEVTYNEGVAQRVKVSPGSIGYMAYEFAHRLGLPMAALENKAGEFVTPSAASGTAALASVRDVPDDLRVFIPDPPGAGAYPIVSYTWLLLYETYPDTAEADALKRAVTWGLTAGQPTAAKLGYIPLPDAMISLAKAKVESIH